MHLHAALVRIGNRLGYVIECEVVGAGAHAELVGAKVYRIGAEAYGKLQLVPASCRCQQFHTIR